MTRLMLHDVLRRESAGAETSHPHESPPVMTVPMIVLAIGSVFAGGLLVLGDRLQHWLAPVVGMPEASRACHTVCADRADRCSRSSSSSASLIAWSAVPA